MTKFSEFNSEIAFGKEHSIKNFTKYINIEKIVLYFLKNTFGAKLCYKINKVINDADLSFYENIGFNKLTNNIFNKISVITTSFNNWDVNQTEGIVTSKMVDYIRETQLGNYLHNFNYYYNIKYDGKKILNWFPHFGEVSITYLNQELIMLPIQFMVVEMFNDVNSVDLDNVQNAIFFSNYSHKFRNDIIGSLISSGMFRLESIIYGLNSGKNDRTIMVLQSCFTQLDNNFIEIFLNTSDYKNIWENNRREEIVHTREEITSTVINHLLKINSKPLFYDELFTFVKKSIILFELDDLIKQDYIRKLDNLSYEKII
jgi:hypothetical protein